MDGVLKEPQKAPPQMYVWVPKPNELRNPLDTLPAAVAQVAQKKGAAPPRPQARPPPPKREVRYHCEYCDREGHLEEFCFRRKQAVRREQERRNADMYYARVHGPPQCGCRQDARARRVGGGQGDGCAYRAPAGGCFAGRAPSHFQYGYGPRDRGFGGGFEAPRFPRVVFVIHVVDGTGDTLCLVLLTLL